VTGERAARLLLLAVVVGVPAMVIGNRLLRRAGVPPVVELRARMAEAGGWTPGEITVDAHDSLRLRLVSDDVLHGFAVGKASMRPVDLKPGMPVEVTLAFDRPGTYTYYCTRWCGVNHWRMRGTIVVTGPAASMPDASGDTVALPPDLDLDAPHVAAAVPATAPDADRGREMLEPTSLDSLGPRIRNRTSPSAAYLRLRADPAWRDRSDAELWDLVAAVWLSDATAERLRRGRELFAANCAACHGERGDGRGVMAAALQASLPPSAMPNRGEPTDFTDARTMLGASSALLAGKIRRGGMGTGMPSWGPILTDEQVQILVDYLWTFQFAVDR